MANEVAEGMEAQPLNQTSRLADLLPDASVGSRRLEIAAGGSVYEPDTAAKHLYVIHTGQIRIFQADKDKSVRLLEILGPDGWFGAPALAGAAGYGTRAVAVTPVTLSEIQVEQVLAALPKYPGVAAGLVRELALKLQSAYNEAANLVFDDTNQRLIKTLLQFSRSAAAAPVEGPEAQPGAVVLRITHQQLAQAIGAARETVSLALTQLRHRNLLKTGRNRLLFNPNALEDFYRRTGSTAPAQAKAASEVPDAAT